ncbi:MAG: hypothetical protein JOY64_27915 [Alphaproteobacteria bacterium]|nr:hypothetical protein [Alphaproteobacteria bacterium]MBV8411486.1 hypothetical protein [Alphaproteobacteria bacterium]
MTEGNMEIYLSKLHTTWSADERDNLLRLVAAEEARMGHQREHLENGERRAAQGRKRIERQREIVASVPAEQREASPEALLLDTLEQTQALLETHLRALRARWEHRKL